MILFNSFTKDVSFIKNYSHESNPERFQDTESTKSKISFGSCFLMEQKSTPKAQKRCSPSTIFCHKKKTSTASCCFWFYFVFAVPGIEPRASCIVVNYSTSDLCLLLPNTFDGLFICTVILLLIIFMLK
jgi:hypothetical protein